MRQTLDARSMVNVRGHCASNQHSFSFEMVNLPLMCLIDTVTCVSVFCPHFYLVRAVHALMTMEFVDRGMRMSGLSYRTYTCSLSVPG